LSTMTDDLSLDPQRDAWLTARESANWDAFALIHQFSLIGEGDVAVVFGAASGGIASWLLNDRRVANLVVVEDRPEHELALARNFRGRTGVTRITDDPAASMRSIIDEAWPTVVVIDLQERATERDVVMALADENESVDIIIMIYEPFDERAEGLHNMILSWHDEDRRFVSAFGPPAPLGSHRPNAMIAWYSR